MRALDYIYHLIHRFRYPISRPEDVADALGISIDPFISYPNLLSQLTHLTQKPTHLRKFMKREQAEAFFKNALRIDRFQESTLVTYCFNEGSIEFLLSFDEHSHLRRLYIQHKDIEDSNGIEISLEKM